MPVENLPHWSLVPNWRETVSERLRWLSPVLSSPTGAEQRFAVRSTPRRSIEATFSVSRVERAWLDHAITAAGASRWYAPLPHDAGRTTAPISDGSVSIPVETADREFRVGSFVMLRQDLFSTSVHEITGISASALAVSPAVSGNWPAGTLVMPCEVMRLEESPTIVRKTDAVSETSVRFEVDGPSPYVEAAGPVTYDGHPVLTLPPNETGDLTTQHSRLLAEFFTETSRRFVVDVAGKNFSIQQHRWFALDRAERNALRSFFQALQGRRVACWVPTFSADLELLADATAGEEEFTVRRCGYSEFGGARFGRKHIYVERYDGTRLMAEVEAAVINGDSEIIILTAPLTGDLTLGTIKRISFMSLHRLDQDSVEFTHYSDSRGVMTCTAAFRTAGNQRTPTPFVAQGFGDTVKGAEACGTPPFEEGFVVVLTTPGAGTYTVPSGVDHLMIECWGGGGAGGYRALPGGAATGGGGAGYARVDNLLVSPGQVLSYYIANGGAAQTLSQDGDPGEDTWLNKGANEPPTAASQGALARGGQGGRQSSVLVNGAGINATGFIGDVKHDSRNTMPTSTRPTATGGSGSAGFSSNGAADSITSGEGAGGKGHAAFTGGLGGTPGGGAGESNVEAGGGGGGSFTSGTTGGDGGAPGGGGGAALSPASRSGAGARGQIRITFIPD